jgi:hypothetical protein
MPARAGGKGVKIRGYYVRQAGLLILFLVTDMTMMRVGQIRKKRICRRKAW